MTVAVSAGAAGLTGGCDRAAPPIGANTLRPPEARRDGNTTANRIIEEEVAQGRRNPGTSRQAPE